MAAKEGTGFKGHHKICKCLALHQGFSQELRNQIHCIRQKVEEQAVETMRAQKRITSTSEKALLTRLGDRSPGVLDERSRDQICPDVARLPVFYELPVAVVDEHHQVALRPPSFDVRAKPGGCCHSVIDRLIRKGSIAHGLASMLVAPNLHVRQTTKKNLYRLDMKPGPYPQKTKPFFQGFSGFFNELRVCVIDPGYSVHKCLALTSHHLSQVLATGAISAAPSTFQREQHQVGYVR